MKVITYKEFLQKKKNGEIKPKQKPTDGDVQMAARGYFIPSTSAYNAFYGIDSQYTQSNQYQDDNNGGGD